MPVTLGTDGQYHGKLTVGRKANGKLDRRHRTGKTEREVRDKLRALVREIEAGRKLKPGRVPTVESWFTTWLTDIAPYGQRALRPRTLDDYWSKCRNWVFPYIGAHRLDKLEPDHLDALYAAMRRAGKAPSHALKVHAIVRRGLEVAKMRGKITINVAEMIDPPGAARPKRTPLPPGAPQRIVEIAAGRRNGARWLVGLAIGPRQGEALGLCWPCVDLDAGTVEIGWQLQRLTWGHGCDHPHKCGAKRHRFTACRPATRGARKGQCAKHTSARGCPKPCRRDCTGHAQYCPQRRDGGLVLSRPKIWREGDHPRLIHLPEQVVEVLREHHEQQLAERRHARNAWRRMPHPQGGEADLVFRQVDGAPVDPRQDWQEWQAILTEAGIDRERVHAMRHTAATMLIDAGEDIAVIQEVLGHADIRTTRGYSTVRTEATRRAATRMGAALFGDELAVKRASRRSA